MAHGQFPEVRPLPGAPQRPCGQDARWLSRSGQAGRGRARGGGTSPVETTRHPTLRNDSPHNLLPGRSYPPLRAANVPRNGSCGRGLGTLADHLHIDHFRVDCDSGGVPRAVVDPLEEVLQRHESPRARGRGGRICRGRCTGCAYPWRSRRSSPCEDRRQVGSSRWAPLISRLTRGTVAPTPSEPSGGSGCTPHLAGHLRAPARLETAHTRCLEAAASGSRVIVRAYARDVAGFVLGRNVGAGEGKDAHNMPTSTSCCPVTCRLAPS